MERCRCGRDQRFGEAWCPACGQRFGVGAAGLGPGAVPPPRRAGTIVAAQVVLGLGAAGNALLALFGAVSLIPLATYAASSTLVLGSLVVLLYCLAALGFDVWALLAIGKGNRTARLLATVVPAAAVLLDVLVFAVLGSGLEQGVVTIVLAVPHAAALAILLWVPEGSRHHFGDAVPAAPRPVPSGPIPAPRPMPTPASGLSFTSGPLPVPTPRPAPAPDATTVTLPVSARSVAPTSAPAPSARSMAPTLVPSPTRTPAPATPPGGRHRVEP